MAVAVIPQSRERKTVLKILGGLFCAFFRGAALCLVVVCFILLALPPTAAGADRVNPHSDYSSQTDKCRFCHRMHKSLTPELLIEISPVAICTSCHAKGLGADTAVTEGTLMHASLPGVPEGPQTSEGVLLGGGFDSIGNATPTTGKHILAWNGEPFGVETPLPPPGSSETLSRDTSISLVCTSCHNPHLGPNYRMLRKHPGPAQGAAVVQWNGPWTDETQTVQADGGYPAYTERDFNEGDAIIVPWNDPRAGYVVRPDPYDNSTWYGVASNEVTRNYKSGISTWCTGCHTAYLKRGPQMYDAGDKYGLASRYRHGVDVVLPDHVDAVNGRRYDARTDLPLEDLSGDGRTAEDEMTCLTCHRAHGTDAVMHNTGQMDPASRGRLPSGSDSMLLRQDDRIMCIRCHKIR